MDYVFTVKPSIAIGEIVGGGGGGGLCTASTVIGAARLVIYFRSGELYAVNGAKSLLIRRNNPEIKCSHVIRQFRGTRHKKERPITIFDIVSHPMKLIFFSMQSISLFVQLDL